MISPTSRLAYYQILDSLGDRQLKVLKAIKELGSATNTMLSQYLRLPINQITGRTRELFLKGLVVVDKIDYCKVIKKSKCKYWRYKNEEN